MSVSNCIKYSIAKIVITLSIPIFASCDQHDERYSNEILCAFPWKGAKVGETNNWEEHTFQRNGDYSLDVGTMKIHGKWSWVEQDEIQLKITSIEIDGKFQQLPKTLNSYLGITHLSEGDFKFLKRAEGDSWDSGFVKSRHYSRPS